MRRPPGRALLFLAWLCRRPLVNGAWQAWVPFRRGLRGAGHDDDDLPKPESMRRRLCALDRHAPTSSRHTVSYTLPFAPPHVALISARLDRGISAARSVRFSRFPQHSRPSP